MFNQDSNAEVRESHRGGGQDWLFSPHETYGTVHPIYRIVLTGGPCGGKTTAMVFILERLTSMGFKTLIIPEVATRYILSGVEHGDLRKAVFQQMIITGQLHQEKEYMIAARAFAQTTPVVLIFDRGVLDGSAFCDTEDWEAAVKSTGLNPRGARDENYDLVVHLVTAADGAPEAYTLSNNKARREDRDEAIKADRLIQKAWLGHPRLKIIDNSSDFRRKVDRVMDEICKAIGMPTNIGTGKKFLVTKKSVDDFLAGQPHCEVVVKQTYLLSPKGRESRLRKRTQGGHISYFHTNRIFLGGGRKIEEDSIIDEETYEKLLSRKDESREEVVKRRFCLVRENRYMEIDRYEMPVREHDTLGVGEEGGGEMPRELEVVGEL